MPIGVGSGAASRAGTIPVPGKGDVGGTSAVRSILAT